MAIKNVKLSQLEPKYLAFAKAGLPLKLDEEMSTAYSVLWGILTDTEYNAETHPVLSAYSGKLYLPKVYQNNGEPTLIWGGEKIKIDGLSKEQQEQVSFSYQSGNTGYPGAHLTAIWTPEAKLKGAKIVYQTQFPVGIVKAETEADNPHSDFLALVPISPQEAFESFVMTPDPTMGLKYIDEITEATEVELIVVNAVERKGSPQYGGGTYVTAVVEYPQGSGKLYKSRCNRDMSATLQAPLNFPLSAPGKAKKTKTYLNLCDIELTAEDLKF